MPGRRLVRPHASRHLPDAQPAPPCRPSSPPCAWHPPSGPAAGRSHRSGTPAQPCTLWHCMGRGGGGGGSGGSGGNTLESTHTSRTHPPSSKHAPPPTSIPPVAGLMGACRYIPSHLWVLPLQADHCSAGGRYCSHKSGGSPGQGGGGDQLVRPRVQPACRPSCSPPGAWRPARPALPSCSSPAAAASCTQPLQPATRSAHPPRAARLGRWTGSPCRWGPRRTACS